MVSDVDDHIQAAAAMRGDRVVQRRERINDERLQIRTLEPGWRWSTSLRPIQGTPSCQVHHLEVLLAGRFHVEMDDGEAAEFGPGDVFDVPPGHDPFTWRNS